MRKPQTTPSNHFRHQTALLVLLTALCVGCGDDKKSEGDTSPDTLDMRVDTTPDPCLGINECEAARSACDGNTLIACVFGVDGCLDEVRTDCGTTSEVCEATPTRASCEPDPDVCSMLPDVCAISGRSCNGDTLVDCGPDNNGCLVAESTDCTENNRICAGNGAAANCVEAACANVMNPCTSPGTSCDGTDLVTCARDASMCLVETRQDCSLNGEVCDANGATAMCAAACTDHPDCAGQTDGAMTCVGPGIQTCNTSPGGCLEPEIANCMAGEFCQDMAGTPTCTNTCAAATVRLSCADQGTPVMGDTAMGTALFTDYDCALAGSYPGNESVFEFVNPTAATVIVTATFDDLAGDFDLFALDGNMGVCDETNTCEDLSDGAGPTEIVAFETDAGALTYLVLDRFGAGNDTTFTLDVVCDVCGDGVAGPSEECDDGGTMDADGCSTACEVEFGFECDNSTQPSTCTAMTDLGTFAAMDTIPDTTGGMLALGDSAGYTVTFTEEVLLTGILDATTTGDPDFFVLGTDGFVTASAFDGNEIFEIGLLPGTYIFVVSAFDGVMDPIDAYTLSLTVDPLNATDLGTLAPTDMIMDQTGGPITAISSDWYTVTFSAPVLLSGSTTGTTAGDADVLVYDATQAYRAIPDIGLETLTDVELPAGKHIIQVFAYPDDGTVDTYTMSLSTTAAP